MNIGQIIFLKSIINKRRSIEKLKIMKKLLLILLCVTMLYSCREDKETKQKDWVVLLEIVKHSNRTKVF